VISDEVPVILIKIIENPSGPKRSFCGRCQAIVQKTEHSHFEDHEQQQQQQHATTTTTTTIFFFVVVETNRAFPFE